MTATSRAHAPSHVSWPVSSHRRQRHILDQDILLAREGGEDAARGLGIDVSGERRLAGTLGGPLLGAVAAPVQKELVGVYDGAKTFREAESDPYVNRLLEWLGKHNDLLGSLAGFPARVAISRRLVAVGRKFVTPSAERQGAAA